jgi:hypothetical protein
MLHDFRGELEFSHSCSDLPFWDEFYRKAFPNLAAMVDVRKDGWAQRGGIDRLLTLASGRVVSVDEKVRRKAYPDIALERWSDRARKTPGWIQKSLACEFIAYAKLPLQLGFLLPTLILQRAWRIHGRDWIELAARGEYRTIIAQNYGYETESIGVPDQVLLDAIAHDAMRVSWGEGSPIPSATEVRHFYHANHLNGHFYHANHLNQLTLDFGEEGAA